MKTVLLILSTILISSAFAGNNHHSDDHYYDNHYSSSFNQNSYYEGLDILEAAADIPRNRLRNLQCRRYPSNRDLCRIEKHRLKTANRNIDSYTGNIRAVKRHIQSYIYDRDSRMRDLSCSRGRHNPNRDLCRKERQARNILDGDLLPAVNEIIRRNDRPRKDRDRGKRCRRDKRNCNNDGRR